VCVWVGVGGGGDMLCAFVMRRRLRWLIITPHKRVKQSTVQHSRCAHDRSVLPDAVTPIHGLQLFSSLEEWLQKKHVPSARERQTSSGSAW
jgi:hypothetical protein